MSFGNRVAAARANAPKTRFTFQPKGGRNNDHLITSEEIEEYTKREEDADDGKGFRFALFCLVFLGIVVLLFLRADVEFNVLPAIADKSGKDDEQKSENKIEPLIDPIAANYYSMLNVDIASHQEKNASLLAEKERKRELHRLKKAVKASYEGHLTEHTSVQHCGRSCEARHQQMQLAYHVINSKITRDLYDVLDVKNIDSTNRDVLKKKLDEAKENIRKEKQRALEAGEEYTDEDEEIALEEVNDAMEILSNNEARAYYNLYGEKPPEVMKHMSARHGGWGQEMAFARNVHMKVILSILKYLDSWWADMGIIAFVVLFMGITIWVKLPELLELAEQMDQHDTKMREIEDRKKQ